MSSAQVKLYKDIYEMSPDWLSQKGLDEAFLIQVLELARNEAPFYKMLMLWEEASKSEKSEIVADLEEMVADYHERPAAPVELPYVKMEKFSSIAEEIKTFKAFLKKRIEKAGGVSEIANKCRMAQPSLSRFLNNTSLPRKSTLEKLAKALGLSQQEMAFEWTK